MIGRDWGREEGTPKAGTPVAGMTIEGSMVLEHTGPLGGEWEMRPERHVGSRARGNWGVRLWRKACSQ